MTKKKNKKRLVRSRMEKTGETYQAALHKVEGAAPPNNDTAKAGPLMVRHEGRYYHVGDTPLSVGRHPSNALLVMHVRASKHHASFEVANGALRVVDLTSLNGTWVNGKRVSEPTELHAGDAVVIGMDTLEIVDRVGAPPVVPTKQTSATQHEITRLGKLVVGPASRVGAILAGRYRLEKDVTPKIELGGLPPDAPWLLFDATHALLGGLVTIKLLPAKDARERAHLRAWLLREGRALQQSAHPGVLGVMDIGETDDGDVYLVTERAPPQTLAEVIGSGVIGATQALAYFRRVAEILAHVHSRGVVHRDLRAGAIYVAGSTASSLKLTSFTLATIQGEPRLTPIGPLGHPAWTAPEQRAGEDVDARADLYSLGMILFAMLTGRLATDATAANELAKRTDTATLAPVLEKLLARSRGDRYESAVAVLSALPP